MRPRTEPRPTGSVAEYAPQNILEGAEDAHRTPDDANGLGPQHLAFGGSHDGPMQVAVVNPVRIRLAGGQSGFTDRLVLVQPFHFLVGDALARQPDPRAPSYRVSGKGSSTCGLGSAAFYHLT
jgi:hypothetical protein